MSYNIPSTFAASAHIISLFRSAETSKITFLKEQCVVKENEEYFGIFLFLKIGKLISRHVLELALYYWIILKLIVGSVHGNAY